ncbi:putative clathrin assembly protein [Abeliophyllum distichum]|uniref:Clathrin assembly protein n=1 Tax=Abeliophyllum distichum TaxID=126358 RepID=A0ABD1QY11_9LAMI
MAAGSSSQQNFRKAVGALKDSTMVGMAKVNSEFKELDVAILKATNHIEVLPKEKHVRKILDAVSASRPRADVGYCIHALARRLSKTRTWAVAIKTLIIIHRALREVDHSFREELIGYRGCRGHMLNLSHFKDDSSPTAWEYSTWIRIYALYLEERLECFRILKYDFQRDHSRTKRLDTPDLLEQLPALQRLLFRLLACQPVGVARYNFMVQYALSIVAAESVRLYVAITDGVLNLVDKVQISFVYFHKGQILKEALTCILNSFLRCIVMMLSKRLKFIRSPGIRRRGFLSSLRSAEALDFGREQKYVKIEQPPASFITAMEEYVKDAPQILMLPWKMNDDDKSITPKAISVPQADLETDPKLLIDTEESHPSIDSLEIPKTEKSEAPATPLIPDLLSWDEPCQETSELDDNNSLAISTVTTEELSNPAISSDPLSQPTGWELALTTEPSSNVSAVTESKLGSGLDRLTLDSLYDVALAKTNPNGTYHMGMVSSNPFEADSIAQPNYMQLIEMPQQEEAVMQYLHQQSYYAQMNELPQQQEAFMQQYHEQMNHTEMTEMLQQQALMQQQDQQPSYAHQMAEIPHQEEAFKQQQQQEQSMVGHDSTNPFGNPFTEQESKPCPTQEEPSGLSLI